MNIIIIIFVFFPWDSPGKNTGVGCNVLLQEIFLTQELKLGLLHCKQILYQLSYKGRLYIEVCVCQSQSHKLFLPHPFPPW